MKIKREVIIFSPEDFSEHYMLRTILGKKAITHNGVVIGRVSDIGFTRKRVLGFYISAFFVKYFVSMDYVDEFNGEALMLKIDPVSKLKRKIVFDKEGVRLGKVVEIKRPSYENKLDGIVVKKNIFSKPVDIPASYLQIVDKNIILNEAVENVFKK